MHRGPGKTFSMRPRARQGYSTRTKMRRFRSWGLREYTYSGMERSKRREFWKWSVAAKGCKSATEYRPFILWKLFSPFSRSKASAYFRTEQTTIYLINSMVAGLDVAEDQIEAILGNTFLWQWLQSYTRHQVCAVHNMRKHTCVQSTGRRHTHEIICLAALPQILRCHSCVRKASFRKLHFLHENVNMLAPPN